MEDHRRGDLNPSPPIARMQWNKATAPMPWLFSFNLESAVRTNARGLQEDAKGTI